MVDFMPSPVCASAEDWQSPSNNLWCPYLASY
jgi:hypothetical protein